jgi:D-psicose/D-tagatose/L-ribulose 3-epimerase
MGIKTSVHLSSFCDNWNENLEAHIRKSAEIGFDSVEMPLFNANDFNGKNYLKVLKSTGLGVTTGNAITCETDIASKNKEIRQKGIDYLKVAIDKSLQINSECLNGVLYEPWGTIEDFDGENRKWMIQSLNTLGDYLEDVGFNINLELINRYEGKRLNNVEQGLILLDEIESNKINLHIDTFHMNIEEPNMIDSIKNGRDRIKFVHFSENYRGAMGTGSIDFESIVDSLRVNNYEGIISIESFVSNKGDIGNALNIYNESIFKSNTQMIEFGYEYLKKLLKRGEYEK